MNASDQRFGYAWQLGFESERDEGDTYTFEPVAGDKPVAARWSPPRTIWRGPLVAAVARDFTVGDRARGTVHARVDAGSGLVRIAIDGVNLQGQHRLRVRVPPSRRVPGGDPVSAVADMQFGPVTRTIERYDPKSFRREWPVTTAPVHRYVSVASSGLTVFVRGATEYELNPDGWITLTLFRAVGDLSRGELRARPGHAAWPLATPGAQELGPFRVELALSTTTVSGGSHPNDWDDLERQSEEFHAAPAGLMLRYGLDVPAQVPGPELVGAGLAFLSLKPREDGPGVVARCVNLTTERVAGAWNWPEPIRRALIARLDETLSGELPLSRDRRQVRFTAEPRAPVTVVIE